MWPVCGGMWGGIDSVTVWECGGEGDVDIDITAAALRNWSLRIPHLGAGVCCLSVAE